jgi:hypothetical protein
LLQNPAATYAVVDEGPGLSGSSFAAVADWLHERGIRNEQLVFFPGHANELGPVANPANATRWKRARRYVGEFDQISHEVLPNKLEIAGREYKVKLVGEISAGEWRRDRFSSSADWPAAHVQQERRKYLLSAGGSQWLAKFAGLGRYGGHIYNRAVALSAAELTPRLHSFEGGFLISEWLPDSRPATAADLAHPAERGALVNAVARYVAFVAEHFPANRPGATVYELWNMARHNTAEQLGPAAAEALLAWEAELPFLAAAAHPVDTENKMQLWEWLRTSDGRWLKADAVEHHVDHQFVGSQDIAWDVAGATCELELCDEEVANLEHDQTRSSPCSPSRTAREFYKTCYLAFQLGYCSLAARAMEFLPEECERFARRRERCASALQLCLLSPRTAQSPTQSI